MAVDDSYTISLLHFDGADTSITFTDESGKVWTAGGSAQLDTADKKYGASSGLFAVATSDNISTPDHADWTLGSDDWTVELWMKLSSTDFTVSHLMFTTGSNTNVGSDYAIFFTLATGSGIPTCVCGQASGTAVKAAACDAVPDATTWHHYAAVKYGTVLTVYVDGVGGLNNRIPYWSTIRRSRWGVYFRNRRD